jgi:hypothetical protein
MTDIFVAVFSNSHSNTTVESEPASSDFAQPTASSSATAAPATIDMEIESDLLHHSKDATPLKSKALLRHPARMMGAYGYALIQPSDASTSMAEKLRSMDISSLKRDDKSHLFSVISGDVSQFNLTATRELFTRENMTAWDAIMKDAFAQCNLSEETRTLHRVATKLLEAPPGAGEQVVHFDSENGWTATNQFSALLICSSGVDTTAMPRYAAHTEFPKLLNPHPRDLQKVFHLLDPEWFHRVKAKKGQILIFRESVPHHGTRNPKDVGNRRVLFSMWSPQKNVDQDEYQMYPWMVAAKAFGTNSIETAKMLVANAKHQPLERMDPKSFDEYTACLRQHSLTKVYAAASKQ